MKSFDDSSISMNGTPLGQHCHLKHVIRDSSISMNGTPLGPGDADEVEREDSSISMNGTPLGPSTPSRSTAKILASQ